MFKKVLSERPLEIIEKKNIEFLQHDKTVKEAMELLVNKKIRSAPYIQDQTLYVCDHVDFVAHLVNCVKKKSGLKEFFNTKISAIGNMSGTNPKPVFLDSNGETSLLDAASVLLKGHKRVFVTEEDNVVGVWTHTDFIKWLSKELSKNSELSKKSIGELNVYEEIVAIVSEDTNIMEAFDIMVQKKVDYLPIKSLRDGKIISVLSVRDLKLFLEIPDERLFKLNTLDFISQCRQHSSNVNATYPIFLTTLNTDLQTVTEKLLKTRVHRLIIAEKPLKNPAEVSVNLIVKKCVQ